MAFQHPDNPENQNFKIEQNTRRFYHFTHLNHKWQSYDVWFLRYGARQGQSSRQVHRRCGIHILKISSNFYILLVSLRRANPKNFSSITLFVEILWPFEYSRVHLIFLVMRFFWILGSNYQKFSNLQSLRRCSLKYVSKLL